MKDDIFLLLKYLAKILICSMVAIPLLFLSVWILSWVLPVDLMFPAALILGVFFGIIDIIVACWWWAATDLENFP